MATEDLWNGVRRGAPKRTISIQERTMETGEKIFRHSLVKLVVMFFGALFFGFLAFVIQIDYFLLGIAGIALMIALFYATSRVKVSNDEITTNRLLGSKSLRWSEIARVSTFGQAVRLHNYDDDLVLTLDSQLDGYADMLDIVFSKRPDLLDREDSTVMTISWLGAVSTLGIGVLIIIMGIVQFLETQDFEKIFSLIFLAIGLSFIVRWFLSPNRLTLEDKNLTLGYWFVESSYSARDIDHISLEKQRSRNGYVYIAQINLTSGMKIKLPAFKQGAHLTYQILKRWHKRAVSNQASF